MYSMRTSLVKTTLIAVCATAMLIACNNPDTPTAGAASSAADITAFSIVSPAATGSISGTEISVTVPWYTSSAVLSDLVADFKVSAGATVTVGGSPQTSGTTANDFSSPVTYTVTAQDGSTTQSYTVTVTVAGLNLTDETTAGGSNASAHGLRWQAVASSSDGTKLVAAETTNKDIWTSSDGGTTWVDQTSGTSANGGIWFSVASSADGTKLAAVEQQSGDIWISKDSGATWVNKTKGTSAAGRAWSTIAMSDDGSKLVAVEMGPVENATGGDIWTSADGGKTWNDQTTSTGSNASANGLAWTPVASSADGSKLVAAEATNGDIWTSSDSGLIWADETQSGAAHGHGWRAIASSSDGTKLAAVVLHPLLPGFGGDIWTSTDSGATWVDRTPSGSMHDLTWQSIASSADGTILAAVESGTTGNGGDLWTSTDGGKTWVDQTSSGSAHDLLWSGVAISSDGSRLVAVGSGSSGANSGDIWIGK